MFVQGNLFLILLAVCASQFVHEQNLTVGFVALFGAVFIVAAAVNEIILKHPV